jgi:hypothetical protein
MVLWSGSAACLLAPRMEALTIEVGPPGNTGMTRTLRLHVALALCTGRGSTHLATSTNVGQWQNPASCLHTSRKGPNS